ncbi:MAG: hypothetical protein ACLUFH_11425 [Monoglobales bacterium]
MAYFDSAKNRAIWERELDGLRQEKEKRAARGYVPETVEKKEKTPVSESFGRRKINLQELEQIEREQSGIRRVRRPTREKPFVREREPGMEIPQMGGKSR